MAECPWCGGVTGKPYARMKKEAGEPSARDLEEMAELKDKPFNPHDVQTLIAMSMGSDALRMSSHPWIEGGGTVSSYSLLKLEAFGLVERRAQRFTEQRFGTRWKITDLGGERAWEFLNQSSSPDLDSEGTSK